MKKCIVLLMLLCCQIAWGVSTPIIPTKLSQLSDDTSHRLTTDAEKDLWNGKQVAIGNTSCDLGNGYVLVKLENGNLYCARPQSFADDLTFRGYTTSASGRFTTKALFVGYTSANRNYLNAKSPLFTNYTSLQKVTSSGDGTQCLKDNGTYGSCGSSSGITVGNTTVTGGSAGQMLGTDGSKVVATTSGVAVSASPPTSLDTWMDTTQTIKAKVMFVSDMHIASNYATIFARLQAALAALSPDILVFTGDQTSNDWSDWAQVATAVAWVKTNYPNLQIHGLMGNHDYSSYYPLGSGYASGGIPYEIESVLTSSVSIGDTVIHVKSSAQFLIGKPIILKALPDTDRDDTYFVASVSSIDEAAKTVTLSSGSPYTFNSDTSVLRQGKDPRKQIAQHVRLFGGNNGVVTVGNTAFIFFSSDGILNSDYVTPVEFEFVERQLAAWYGKGYNLNLINHLHYDWDSAALGGISLLPSTNIPGPNVISHYQRWAASYPINSASFGHHHQEPGVATMYSVADATWSGLHVFEFPSLYSTYVSGMPTYPTYGWVTMVEFVAGASSFPVKYYRVNDVGGTVTLVDSTTIPLTHQVTFPPVAEAKIRNGEGFSNSLFARNVPSTDAPVTVYCVNRGAGTEVCESSRENSIRLKSLVAGNKIDLSNTKDEITISDSRTDTANASYSSNSVTGSVSIGSSALTLSSSMTLTAGDLIKFATSGTTYAIAVTATGTSHTVDRPVTASVSSDTFTVYPVLQTVKDNAGNIVAVETSGSTGSEFRTGFNTSAPWSIYDIVTLSTAFAGGISQRQHSGSSSATVGVSERITATRGTATIPTSSASGDVTKTVSYAGFLTSTGTADSGIIARSVDVVGVSGTVDATTNPMSLPMYRSFRTGKRANTFPTLTLTPSGNLGVNATSLALSDAARVTIYNTPRTVFGGTSANSTKLSYSGTYTGTTVAEYRAVVDSGATTFSWTRDGVSGGSGVAITPGSAQLLSDGVYVTFTTTSGLVAGDNWFGQYSGNPLTIYNTAGNKVMSISNTGTVSDISGDYPSSTALSTAVTQASTALQPSAIGTTIQAYNSNTTVQGIITPSSIGAATSAQAFPPANTTYTIYADQVMHTLGDSSKYGQLDINNNGLTSRFALTVKKASDSTVKFYVRGNGEVYADGGYLDATGTLPSASSLSTAVSQAGTALQSSAIGVTVQGYNANTTTQGTITASSLGAAPLNAAAATGAWTFDTSTLSIDSTNHRVGIGTTTPEDMFNFVHSGSATNIFLDNYASVSTPAPSIAIRSSRGTSSAPLRVRSGDLVLNLGARMSYAADNTSTATMGTAGRASYRCYAAEDQTSTASGTYCGVYTTLIGSTTTAEKLRVEDNGVVRVIGSSTACPTCSSTYRGGFCFVQGGAGVADTLQTCGKSSADSYSWKAVVSY